MTRLPAWPELLAAYIDARRDMPFGYPANDCCSFAAGAVEAMTGTRPLLPEYASERDALRLLKSRSLRDRVGDALGPEIGAAFAQRGDVVLFVQDERETLSVCVGEYLAAPSADGLLLIPRAAGVTAWRV